MCQFKSLIVKKDGTVHWTIKSDSHEDLIKGLGLVDDTSDKDKMTFARVEILPPNGNVFEQDLKLWKLNIDQQITPSWWNYYLEKKCFEKLEELLSKQVLIGKEIAELKDGIFFLKNTVVQDMSGNSVVQGMRGNSVVQDMRGNSVVQVMYDNSVVKVMYDNSVVKVMYDNSVVQDMHDNSVVQDMRGNSVVQVMSGNSVVQDMHDNSVVQDMRGNSVVKVMYDNSVVQVMRDNSVVQDMRGNSVVKVMYDNSVVQDMRDNSVVQDMRGNSVVKVMYDNSVVQDMYGLGHYFKDGKIYVVDKKLVCVHKNLTRVKGDKDVV